MAPATAPRTRTASADSYALGSRVRLVVTDPEHLDACSWLLARSLAEVDAACSRFRKDSELVALDSAGGLTTPVSPLLADALATALRAARLTKGAVDPTVGSAMEAIGYDRDYRLVERDGLPVRLEVHSVPGHHRITLDCEAGTVTVPRGIRLDLGATAKAWAADRAARHLAEASGCGVLVSLGGDTAVAGPPPADGWRIRVQDITGHPHAVTDGPQSTVTIREGGLATSGTAARNWLRGGRPLHHIIDPTTGTSADSPGARCRWRRPPAQTPTRRPRPHSPRAPRASPGCAPRTSRPAWSPTTARSSP